MSYGLEVGRWGLDLIRLLWPAAASYTITTISTAQPRRKPMHQTAVGAKQNYEFYVSPFTSLDWEGKSFFPQEIEMFIFYIIDWYYA